ncbi:MAG: hypothetical protein WAP35_06555, partial [Solirubrobacterales bacterium]
MTLKDLIDKGKKIVEDHGGVDGLKETVTKSATEIKDIATGEGTVTDKLKGAADVVKEAGAEGGSAGGG